MKPYDLYSMSLCGDWEFTYSKEGSLLSPPKAEDFTTNMPVPGLWDDHIESLKKGDFWSCVQFNPDFKPVEFPLSEAPVDASLPYIIGVGWYRKTFDALSNLVSSIITLNVGGVRLEAWIWLNGTMICHHLGHSTPFKVILSDWIRPGEPNELIIAVSNTRTDRSGCALRGYQGRSAGIYGDMYLTAARLCSIYDCYVYPHIDENLIQWNVELRGDISPAMQLDWNVIDPSEKKTVGNGSMPVTNHKLSWQTNELKLKQWSDRDPYLYQIEVRLRDGDDILDYHTQPFGLRIFTKDGSNLHLNGEPVYLRGATDHCYFSMTCTPPSDINYYIDIINKMKQIGFNWIRCHTWVPSEEYMMAADMMGMLIQVEAPVGFEEKEWIDILRACRRHPSVVLYCCGNEELLDEAKIGQLRRMAALCHEIAPDALFNPQEALRGVEYGWNDSDLGDDIEDWPYPHNPGRLSLLREFSDLYGQYTWGFLSYNSKDGNWRTIDDRLDKYELPCLSHEIGIHSSYLDLSLEDRYSSTRIGADLFSSAKDYLESNGVLEKATLYYRNSCAWMRSLRKHNVEMARKCRLLSGYDFLGAIDHHWHRTGYTGGIMNEFYELKYGETTSDVLKYNAESVLLLDHSNQRNLMVGDNIELDLMVSLFGKMDLHEGIVQWSLVDDTGTIHMQNEWPVADIPRGSVESLGKLKFTAPNLNSHAKIILQVTLTGGDYSIDNNWDFWLFPETTFSYLESVKIAKDIDDDTLSFLNDGGRVLLLGHGPFPAMQTDFQMACSGRAYGNLATVIYNHPVTNSIPHNGYCDWQFCSMLDGGFAVLFNETDLPFDPIIEVVSSYKHILKQSNLFEFNVGNGRMMVCCMNLDESDPGAAYLLGKIIEYCSGEEFNPAHTISTEQLAELMTCRQNSIRQTGTDMAFDPNAQR